jgi:hypothetical protein
MCASRNSSGWDFDTVATFPGAQLLISLELHPEPAMAIVVSTGGGTSLWYARRSVGQWTVDDLGSPAVAWPPSLAFDGGDRPHIAFVHPAATLNGTEVAMLNGASAAGPFALAVVDTSGHGPCALAWDRVRDRPRLAYGARLRDPTWGTLEEQYRYAYAGVDGAWHYTLVSEVIGPATNPLSLALDPWGSPGVGWTRVSAIGPTGID